MDLCYQTISGRLYAKLPGKSVRRNGKVVKEGVVYLGRVIDKEHNVFCNKSRGIYTYDPSTETYGSADETYVTDDLPDNRKKQKMILDFGDAYFLDNLFEKMGYNEVLEAIPYRNHDTLHAMAGYYILCQSANEYAQIWYEGSFFRILYPKANLTSQRVSDFLASLGKPETVTKFFDAHVKWLMNQCDDPAILMDSTGLPNDIHFPLTAVSNHNGKISREVRMTTLVQRDTGYPVLFRITPGNIIDLSTMTRTLNEAYIRGMNVDFSIMDSIYYTNENIEELYTANVDFLTRLNSKFNMYKQIVKEHLPTLRQEENLVQYKDRYVYIKRVDIKIGDKGHDAYAYLGYDIDRASDETHKAVKGAKNKKASIKDLHDTLQEAGVFLLVASLPFTADGVLPAYYTRQLIEQYFDISKGISKLTPLRIHSEESLYGHLIMSMIAAVVNVYIQGKMKKIYSSRDAMFMTLRNQKCTAYSSKVTTCEPQKQANEFYKKFQIDCPLYFEKKEDKFEPRFHLPKINSDESV